MADTQSRNKWNNIYQEKTPGTAEPCALLREFAHLLPTAGAALDVASGLGGNALWLARRGLDTTALDISDVAVQRINDYAHAQTLNLRGQTVDFTQEDVPPGAFDVIVVSHYLERRLAPQLRAALRPGGLLFYQTFVQETVDAQAPKNLQFRLTPNELLQLFNGLHVIYYREEGRVGDAAQGLRNVAQLIVQRRD
ncbi:MAG: class I SAM-dependent methyltransferase [Gammaproteobacteria bacterium]|nr:class I SAM-dependent methyltransferase [Gammaproteobacteria bacterium]